MKKIAGFTLIEILIALSVFAIIASMTSSTLYYAFTTRTRVNQQSERLNALQMTVSFIQQDVTQIVGRAIRGNDMRLFPLFIGKLNYMEFTRDGQANPGSMEKRSTLKRIAYICHEGLLKRRTWETLDPPNRAAYEERILINNLTDCHFGYLNQTLQVFPDWRADAVNEKQNKESLPKAVQINLTLRALGEINLLFPVPEALYG